jgi:hypothetical protein
MNGYRDERDRLLDMYSRAEGEERAKILARLVVIDEQTERKEDGKSAEKHDQA